MLGLDEAVKTEVIMEVIEVVGGMMPAMTFRMTDMDCEFVDDFDFACRVIRTVEGETPSGTCPDKVLVPESKESQEYLAPTEL